MNYYHNIILKLKNIIILISFLIIFIYAKLYLLCEDLYIFFKVKPLKCPYCNKILLEKEYLSKSSSILVGHERSDHTYEYHNNYIFLELKKIHSKEITSTFQFVMDLNKNLTWNFRYYKDTFKIKTLSIPFASLRSKKDFDKKIQSILLLE